MNQSIDLNPELQWDPVESAYNAGMLAVSAVACLQAANNPPPIDSVAYLGTVGRALGEVYGFGLCAQIASRVLKHPLPADGISKKLLSLVGY